MAASPAAPACDERKIQAAQVRCFADAAKSAADPGICERASDLAVRFNCLSLYAEHAGEAATCERIAEYGEDGPTLRDACIVGVAMARREVALCLQIKPSGIRDTCHMMYMLRFGADPDTCSHIANSALHHICIEHAPKPE